MLRPSWFSSTNIVGWNIDLSRSRETGTRWDQQIPEAMLKKWNKWNNNLPEKVVVPRAFRLQHEKTEVVDFHVFSDASITGTAVALYAVIYQSSGASQGLVSAKSRLSIMNLTIPRLELVFAMHMAANLCKNIKDFLGRATNQKVL